MVKIIVVSTKPKLTKSGANLCALPPRAYPILLIPTSLAAAEMASKGVTVYDGRSAADPPPDTRAVLASGPMTAIDLTEDGFTGRSADSFFNSTTAL